MAENKTEKPVPKEPLDASVDGSDEGLLADEGDVTVILPDEDLMAEGEGDADVTETLPSSADVGGEDGDVFVLLPDGEDEAIPLVDTEEVGEAEVAGLGDMVDATEVVSGPALHSTFDSATGPSAENVGLRNDNPVEFEDDGATERLCGDELTEDCLIAEEPTDPMGPGDLEDLASEVADDFITADSVAPLTPAGAGGRGFNDETDRLDSILEDEFAHKRSRRGGGKKWVAMLAAAVVLAAAGAWFWFPDAIGLAAPDRGGAVAIVPPPASVDDPPIVPVGDPVSVTDPVDGSSSSVDGPGGVGEVDAELALASRRVFRARFLSSIELGFSAEVRR